MRAFIGPGKEYELTLFQFIKATFFARDTRSLSIHHRAIGRLRNEDPNLSISRYGSVNVATAVNIASWSRN